MPQNKGIKIPATVVVVRTTTTTTINNNNNNNNNNTGNIVAKTSVKLASEALGRLREGEAKEMTVRPHKVELDEPSFRFINGSLYKLSVTITEGGDTIVADVGHDIIFRYLPADPGQTNVLFSNLRRVFTNATLVLELRYQSVPKIVRINTK